MSFVEAAGEVGRIVSLGDEVADVEFFDGPTGDGTTIEQIPAAEVSPLTLEPQTVVWFHDGSTWQTGRIDGWSDTNGYFVALPKKEMVALPADQLRVRRRRPVDDPVAWLGAKASGSGFFHNRRQRFVSEMLYQSSAAGDLHGILSSGVDLHRHQVNAARKVLLDPVRRYLLADEVGLGKTIEAGMIIRQMMLDQRGTRVTAIVPEALVGQWEDELDKKFRVQGFNDGWVDVHPHEWLDGDQPAHESEILVVDEAHRLTASTASDRYQRLAAVAVATPSCLLLTATPVRSNEDAFLGLLHLLDPERYDLADLEGFRRRVEMRDEIGDAVTLLQDDSPLFLMEEAIDTLSAALDDDSILQGLLTQLISALNSSEDQQARGAARTVRGFVSDTYRVHQRMIRTRRDSTLDDVFPVRRRERADTFVLVDDDPVRNVIASALDTFRAGLVLEDGLPRHELLRTVGARCAASTPALAGLHRALVAGDDTDLAPDERVVIEALDGHPLGQELAANLVPAVEGDHSPNRLAAASDWAYSHAFKRKVAAFTSYTSVGRAMVEAMGERYGPRKVAALLSDMDAVDLEEAYRRAQQDPGLVLLVCDRVAEEGWNLQFLDEVLHLDVPWSANRLEQRLGRFDRYQARADRLPPVRSVVVRDQPDVDRLTGAWLTLLDQAVDVFNRSSALLQYALPEREQLALQRALDAGFSAIAADVREEAEHLDSLRTHIEGQDLLDAVSDDIDDEYVDRLLAADARWERLQSATDKWFCQALRFQRNDGGPPWRFSTSTRDRPLLTESEVRALGLEHFNVPYVFSRADANDGALFRPGDPLADGILEACLADDRGAVVASIARGVLGPDSTPVPVFTFNLIVHPAPIDESAVELAREAASHFPSLPTQIHYVPGRGEPPKKLLRLLRQLEHENLGPLPDVYTALTAGTDWLATCRRAESTAKRLVLERSEITEAVTRARQSFETAKDREALIAATRATIGADNARDPKMFDQLEDAVTNPQVHVDSCSVTFLVSTGWEPDQ